MALALALALAMIGTRTGSMAEAFTTPPPIQHPPGCPSGSATTRPSPPSCRYTPITITITTTTTTARYNWVGDLWEEVIEFSTYGPGERRLLKAQREETAIATAEAETETETETTSDVAESSPLPLPSPSSTSDSFLSAFQQAKQQNAGEGDQSSSGISLGSFQSAKKEASSSAATAAAAAAAALAEGEQSDNNNNNNNKNSVDDAMNGRDGYALRDLLVAQWGVPLDVDFERGNSNASVYVTILPIAFGSRRCRHASELDYLRHLQAVLEILDQYDNLDEWWRFLETTSRVPKPGIESVPFRLTVKPSDLKRILGNVS